MFARPLHTRRDFLGAVTGGFGALALGALMNARASVTVDPINPFLPPAPHFAPKAKSVSFLYMVGAPSSIDTFDYKPELQKLGGKPVPASFRSRPRACPTIPRMFFGFAIPMRPSKRSMKRASSCCACAKTVGNALGGRRNGCTHACNALPARSPRPMIHRALRSRAIIASASSSAGAESSPRSCASRASSSHVQPISRARMCS